MGDCINNPLHRDILELSVPASARQRDDIPSKRILPGVQQKSFRFECRLDYFWVSQWKRIVRQLAVVKTDLAATFKNSFGLLFNKHWNCKSLSLLKQ